MTDFSIGDRVAALPNTVWDSDWDDDHFSDSELAYPRLYGHHGHVVEHCGSHGCCWHSVHVRWEGVHDGRAGPTAWTDGRAWHMGDNEIEHVD